MVHCCISSIETLLSKLTDSLLEILVGDVITGTRTCGFDRIISVVEHVSPANFQG